MYCTKTQSIINTLLSFKDSTTDLNKNKIASVMSIPRDKWTRQDKETICATIIEQMRQNQENKIASVNKKGEVAELKSLLNLYQASLQKY